MKINIIDERKYPLPGLNKDTLSYYRWEHRATLTRAGRKYIAFVDNGIRIGNKVVEAPKTYVEEITTGNLEQIKDDMLWQELAMFCKLKGFMDIQLPLMKDKK